MLRTSQHKGDNPVHFAMSGLKCGSWKHEIRLVLGTSCCGGKVGSRKWLGMAIPLQPSWLETLCCQMIVLAFGNPRLSESVIPLVLIVVESKPWLF